MQFAGGGGHGGYGSGGTLTVSHGVASIELSLSGGNYATSNFVLGSDNWGGIAVFFRA